jgi:hypothetical protein
MTLCSDIDHPQYKSKAGLDMKTLTLAMFLSATLSAQPAESARALEDYAFSTGLQAYVYGYPLVLLAATQPTYLSSYGMSVNQLGHSPDLRTPARQVAVMANVDTLYTFSWLDLSSGPLWFHVPKIEGRYYTFQFIDGYTDNFAYVGTRTNGGAAGDYAILPPHWTGKVAAGLQRIEAPTPVVWMIGRILAGEAEDDLRLARALQRQFTLAPLRDFGNSIPKSDLAEPRAAPARRLTAPQSVAAMNAATFFANLAKLMSVNEPHARDQALVRQFAAIGLTPGGNFDLEKLEAPVRRGLERAVASARALIESRIGATGPMRNGWRFYDIGHWQDNYLRRAAFAWLALAGNDPEESIYVEAFADSDGRPLSGAYDYRLHFDPGGTPPANAFWSLTMYDTDRYLVENPIHRYAIRDRTPGLRYNSDGSLDIYVSRTAPSGHESNWLPAPTGELARATSLPA